GHITPQMIHSLNGLTRLHILDLRGCDGVTDEILDILAGHPSLKSLSVFECSGPTRQGIIRFRHKSKCTIYFDKHELK
ncbi:MAG: hypothetical protein Q4G59_04845, partial [Planctomycetia bacterium]|nr:hypothetical protein [Planctomycetia bacterium]